MRQSGDEIHEGRVWNGFDYKLQVWVVDGIIQDCNHPLKMKATGCCTQHQLADQNILITPGAETKIDTIQVEEKYSRR